MEKNKMFIETVMLCGGVKIDSDLGDILKNLSDSDIDLRTFSKEIEDMFYDIEGYNKLEVVLKNISIALRNNKGHKDIKEYLGQYKRFLSIYMSTFNDRKISTLDLLNSSKDLGPFWGLKPWMISSYVLSIEIDGKKRVIQSVINGSSMINTLEIDGVNNGIAGIFLKNGKPEYVSVRSLKQLLHLLRRAILNDDYEFVILPRRNNWSKCRLHLEYLKEFDDVGVEEYLDLIAYIGYWNFDDKDLIADYDRIKRTKSPVRGLLDMLANGVDKEYALKIIRAILDKIECLSKSEQEQYISMIQKLLDLRLNRFKYIKRDDEFEKLSNDIDNLKNINELIDYLKFRGIGNVERINGRNKVYSLSEIEGKDKIVYLNNKGYVKEIKRENFNKILDKQLWDEGFMLQVDFGA